MSTRDHTKHDETPGWWWKRLEEAFEVWKSVEKKHYRVALRNILDLQIPPVVVGSDRFSPFDDETPHNGVEQIDVMYLPRYMRWVRSQTFDDSPEIRYPRFTEPDTMFGDVVAETMLRVGDEADEWREWGNCIEDAGTDGAFAVWYGVAATDDVVSREMLYDSSKPAAQVIEEGVISGVGSAHVGQDHTAIMEAAQAQALDPATVMAPDGEQVQERLFNVAEAHAAMLDSEEKKPKSWGFGKNEVWVQRRPVGEWTLWDSYCDDIRDARFIARKIVLDVDVARKHPAFKPSVAREIQAGNWRYTLGREDNTTSDIHSEDTGTAAWKCAIWEIWDRKYQERHYIAEGIDKFLEKDASNPYVDKRGEPLIKGFFPCVVHAPTMSNKMDPERPYGIPQMAPAWPLQRLAIKLLSHNLDAVKKLSVRQFVYLNGMETEILDGITSGITGSGVEAPAGYDGPLDNVVRPLNFGSVPGELFQQFVVAERKLAMVLAWPLSQMTGEPQADTATAEEISVQAGVTQMGDFIREMEVACAKGQEIKRALIREFYTEEQIVELIGAKHLDAWRQWQQSSLAGDRLSVKFASRVQNENPIRRNQVFEAIQFLSAFTDQTTGIPKYEVDYLIDEWMRMLGMGAAVRHEPTELELQMAMQAMSAPQQPEGGPPPNGKEKRQTGERPPDRQQMGAKVGNVGPNPTRGRLSAFQT